MRSSDILHVYKKIKDDAEQRLVKKQARCEHIHWCTRCSKCKKILDSEVRDLKRRKGADVKTIII